MKFTSIHNVAVTTVLSGCESGISGNNSFTMLLLIITVGTTGNCVGIHSLNS